MAQIIQTVIEGMPFDPSNVGVVGLCVLFVVALTRGWIVTRREVDDIRQQRDDALARAEGRTQTDEVILDLLRAIKYGTPTGREDAP